MRWAELARNRWPALGLMFHIPNEGERDIQSIMWFKRMGLKAGVPDLFLPFASHGHHGLFIELKAREGGRVTDKQSLWLQALNEQGYLAVVCQGAEAAIKTLTWYLQTEQEH